eukprot:TRINITY_DN35182_c0_g1_i2.p1 TRINITY_DN35182_c0_g1~~TRINITY_DN35182_c0_g1_i2.p1  ORF type:complete len:204 (+),score=10.39 TRINITY_DN35182_c0_g1_i2:254-865(+)
MHLHQCFQGHICNKFIERVVKHVLNSTSIEDFYKTCEAYIGDDLAKHESLRDSYDESATLESAVLDVIKDSAIAVLEKCIKLLKKLLDYIKEFFAGFGNKISNIALKLKSIPSRKKKMIALNIKNIEVKVATLKANTELSQEEIQSQVDVLLNEKSKLEEDYKFLGQNYIISEEHFDLIRKIDNNADVALRTLVSTHSPCTLR